MSRTFDKNSNELAGLESVADDAVKQTKRVPFLESIDEDTGEWLQEQMSEYMRLIAYYRCALMEVETKFNVLNEEFSLVHDRNPINSVKTRIKSFRSIKEKLERRGLPYSFKSVEENIHDVAGIRIICSFTEDVKTLAEALLKQDDVTLIEKKDYISNPKENGYRSLHLIVGIPIFLASEKKMMKVEIQLRTIAMDCWASLEHQLRYKKNGVHADEMAAELLECAEISAQLDRRMDALRELVQDGQT